jgi:hypothetical protein
MTWGASLLLMAFAVHPHLQRMGTESRKGSQAAPEHVAGATYARRLSLEAAVANTVTRYAQSNQFHTFPLVLALP